MIFLLTRVGTVDWDEYRAKAIIATDEAEARRLADETVGDEGKIWQNGLLTNCEVIDPNGKSVVFCEDFHAG